MKKWLLFSFALVAFAPQLGLAEVIFYKKQTKIAEVDCNTQTLILDNVHRTQMKVRQPIDGRYGSFCQRLSQFAESSGTPAKTVTLLTVESRAFGDFIVEQEVVGIVDKDHIVSAMSVVDHELVQTRLCSIANTGMRSQPKVCLSKSSEGHYFIEATSVQSGRFAKTSIVSSSDDSIVLESKDSKGRVEMAFSGKWDADKKVATGTIQFENGGFTVMLKPEN